MSARVYWLCGIVGEPGADTTPWPDPVNDEGWEDDLGHPRSAAELVAAIDATWAIVDRCLDRWTPDMLDDEIERGPAPDRPLAARLTGGRTRPSSALAGTEHLRQRRQGVAQKSR